MILHLSQQVLLGQARMHLTPCRASCHVRHYTLLVAVIHFHGATGSGSGTLERCHEAALGIEG